MVNKRGKQPSLPYIKYDDHYADHDKMEDKARAGRRLRLISQLNH